MPIALLFPGQNSRYPEMFVHLLRWDPANEQVIERASDTLGRDLRSHFRPENPDIFTRNRDVQIGVFLANHMHWQNLQRAGIHADHSAGLSLGEYNHLVHIGALSFEDALRILDARGEAYERGARGMMTAVFPVSPEDVEAILARQDRPDQVAIGMYNSPRQCVLSGSKGAVSEATRAVEDELAAHSVVIEERLPMHSPIFRSTGDALRPNLESAAWHTPQKPYLPNIQGRFVASPERPDFVDLLARHTWNPVRWRESMETLASESKEMVFVETGPKSVLSDFFGKKWLNPKRFRTDVKEHFQEAMEAMLEELTGGPARAAFPG